MTQQKIKELKQSMNRLFLSTLVSLTYFRMSFLALFQYNTPNACVSRLQCNCSYNSWYILLLWSYRSSSAHFPHNQYHFMLWVFVLVSYCYSFSPFVKMLSWFFCLQRVPAYSWAMFVCIAGISKSWAYQGYSGYIACLPILDSSRIYIWITTGLHFSISPCYLLNEGVDDILF